MQKKINCIGCGAKKQNTNVNEVGYIKDLTMDYCYDCFQLKNYGKASAHYHPSNYFPIKENSFVFVIQSIMQLDLLFDQPISRIQPNAKYTYLINQVDLLPKDTNLDYLLTNIVKLANKNKVKYEDIILMSALNKNDILNLKDYILNLKEEDIYLFGYQNSGKSTIIKSLTNNEAILNLNKAGLTQEVITEKLEDKNIYDMPGTFVNGYLAEFFEYELYRKMLPKKQIKPKIYQLKNTQKLVINDFIEISFTGSSNLNIVLYLNDFNKITKYNINNPNNYLNDQFEYITRNFKTFSKQKSQITVADLMFIQIDKEVTIKIKAPKNMHITIMESLLK